MPSAIGRMRLAVLGCVSMLVATPCRGDIPSPPPPQWSLAQNDPEPFCGATRIEWAAPAAAHIELTVFNSDATQVVRQLVNEDRVVTGLFIVIWDGRDSDGNLVGAGAYPYTLRATDIATHVVLFEATKAAHSNCGVSVQPQPWTGVKILFR